MNLRFVQYQKEKMVCRAYPTMLLMVLCAGLLWLSGCEKQEKAAEVKAEFAVDKEYKKGPLTVHVKVDRGEISIADTVRLRLEATIDEKYEVTMPGVAEQLKPYELGLLDFRSFPDRLVEDNRLLVQREYVLAPIVSGSYTIAELAFMFTEKQPAAGGDTAQEATAEPAGGHELRTEAIPIEVTSLLDEKRGDLTITDIKAVAELPQTHKRLWMGIAITAAALAAAATILYFLLRKKKEKLIRILRPAHEIAYERLRKLTEEDLIGKGQIKEFYERISDILRRYIEHRFDLHAPERTTEEFLLEARQSQTLSENHKTALKNFLEHCDMVKFACYAPSTAEIQKTFDLTKEFIETTRLDQCRIDVTEQVMPPQAAEPARSM